MNKDKKNMLPKKLDRAWAAYLVDLNAGPTLMMISMRFPERAEKLNKILHSAINKFYKERRSDVTNPDMMVSNLNAIILDLVNSFVTKNLSHTLTEGMPLPPSIIPFNKLPSGGKRPS